MNKVKKNCESDSRTPCPEIVQSGTSTATRASRATNSTIRNPWPRPELQESGDESSSTRRYKSFSKLNGQSRQGGPKSEIRNRSPRNAQRESRAWWCIDLDTIDYDEAWKLQTAIVEARINRVIDKDIVLILEHPSVFTLGRRGGMENLLVSKSFLEKSGIAVTQVERGGNITYHGPGQLVVYPIVDLEAAKISVVEFVEALENVMIQTTAVWGISAERNAVNRGIWVGNKKIGSIGIALRKGISFHGLALNVNLDLTPFAWIQPCGLQGVRMTSMQQELFEKVSMAEAQNVLTEKFESVFGTLLVDTSYAELNHILKTQKNQVNIYY